MAASINNPADVVNLALRRIGYKLRVGTLYEGSEASKPALDIYGQTRDELLRMDDWGFAERNIALTLLKTAPFPGYVPPRVWTGTTDPPLPWIYEYTYPADCLKVRAIKRAPIFVPNFDQRPNVFDTPNDNYLTPPAKVIVCNVASAQCVYTGRVTDPTTWEVGFVEALAASLARRLAPVLATLDVEKIEGADEQVSTQLADARQG